MALLPATTLLGTSLLSLAALTNGCSGSDPLDVETGCQAITATDPATGQPGPVESGSTPACPGMCSVVNADFCAGSAVTNDCAAPGAAIDLCGVSLKAPPKSGAQGPTLELARSKYVDEYAGSGPPALDCLMAGGYPDPPKPSESKLVKLAGIAKIFSHGCQSRDLEITVKKVIRDGSADDGMPGDTVGTPVTTESDCKTNGVPEEVDDCGTRYECKYEYDAVPTEVELMIVTDGEIWAPIYEYGLFIRNDQVTGGLYDKDVRALAQDDYQVIAQVAMGKNITAGHGALAGEVHDCGDVRLVNAVVDVDTEKFITTYFTDDEQNPLPDLAAKATSTLGLYSALDIAPGPVTVAAAGVYQGKLVGVGYFRGRVFADAVSSFTFRGLRPFQVSAP